MTVTPSFHPRMSTAPAAIASKTPVVLLANTLPKQPPSYHLRFRFHDGEVTLTRGLFDLLAFDEKPKRAALIIVGEKYFITRCDDMAGLNVRPALDSKFGIVSAAFTNKPICRMFAERLGQQAQRGMTIPVATFRVTAAELDLDPDQFTYPLYRLAVDQLSN